MWPVLKKKAINGDQLWNEPNVGIRQQGFWAQGWDSRLEAVWSEVPIEKNHNSMWILHQQPKYPGSVIRTDWVAGMTHREEGTTVWCGGHLRATQGRGAPTPQPREAVSEHATQPGKTCFFRGTVQPTDQQIPFVSPRHQGLGFHPRSSAGSQQLLS